MNHARFNRNDKPIKPIGRTTNRRRIQARASLKHERFFAEMKNKRLARKSTHDNFSRMEKAQNGDSSAISRGWIWGTDLSLRRPRAPTCHNQKNQRLRQQYSSEELKTRGIREFPSHNELVPDLLQHLPCNSCRVRARNPVNPYH